METQRKPLRTFRAIPYALVFIFWFFSCQRETTLTSIFQLTQVTANGKNVNFAQKPVLLSGLDTPVSLVITFSDKVLATDVKSKMNILKIGGSLLVDFQVTQLDNNQVSISATLERGSAYSFNITNNLNNALRTAKLIKDYSFSLLLDALSADAGLSLKRSGVVLSPVNDTFRVILNDGSNLSAVPLTLSVSPHAELIKVNDGSSIALLGDSAVLTLDLSQTQMFRVISEDGVTIRNYTIIGEVASMSPYRVGFNTRGGTAVDTQYISYGRRVQPLSADPIRVGYKFDAWLSDTLSNAPFNFNGLITQDTIVYGSWITYNVTVDFEDTTGVQIYPSQTVGYAGKIARPTDPTQAGKIFVGWYIDEYLQDTFNFDSALTSDVTLYGKWATNLYRVAFNTRGGSVVDTQRIANGDKASLPSPEPTREGYSFVGWVSDTLTNTAFDFNSVIVSDTVLYARWSLNTVSVSFVDTLNVELSATQTIGYGTKTTRPTNPTEVGKTFAGWYVDRSLQDTFNFDSMLTADLTLYGKWATNLYRVAFNTRGGSVVDTQRIANGDKASLPSPEPTREGYSFVGWVSDTLTNTTFDFNSIIVADTYIYAQWTMKKTLEGIAIVLKAVPADLSTYDDVSQSVLKRYPAGTTLVPIYVTQNGTGNKTGSSWSNALKGDAGGLKTAIDNILDESNNKVYLVLVAGGLYKQKARLSMYDNLAIIGGWTSVGGWTRPATSVTQLDGENSYSVIYNYQNGLTTKALLYGVTVQNGRNNIGAGMMNSISSPAIEQVVFSTNEATSEGGGLYNYKSSPTLIQVTFSNNTAKKYGGGVFNATSSSPIFYQVSFISNSAGYGGAVSIEDRSSPIFNYVTFYSNLAKASSKKGVGGAIYTYISSPRIYNSTFYGNTATSNGGAMYMNGNGETNTSVIANSIFWNNTSLKGLGSQMYIYNEKKSEYEYLQIYNTVIQGGLGNMRPSGQYDTAISGGGIESISGINEKIFIYYDRISTQDPLLSSSPANNGGRVQTLALAAGSPAINQGYYIYFNGTTPYYSSDANNWFSDFVTQTPMALPSTAVNKTALDARNYTITDIPDLGAFEYGATAP